jgi:hypothetical protein
VSRVLRDQHLDGGHLAGGRQQVVHERTGHELTVRVVGELLEERAADTLCRAADDLPLDQYGIDRTTQVVGHPVTLDADRP